MKVSSKGEYCLRALIMLAVKKEERLTVDEISKATHVTPAYLEKLLSQLKTLGYINSKRGTRGGFMLQLAPKDIKIGEVIRKLEGPLAPMSCVSVTSYQECALEGSCMLKPLWGLVRDTVADVLDRTTLADLVEGNIGSYREVI
ncbi:Rrf2 family transcriptional regulator [Alkalihalophilus pseudofirmus]|uniref:RrF2 family transcriptional regulator n=1 Tax=Alkalihalophilus pseudofirmus TaxID=79885 RepID=UPI00259BAB69|nr:Rrf2 family transcriptional regulator [Alkalihalophilus pseudofirmus]WEG17892.1 Rrf2 family transcriptional regulator [Alkalihalophilus pseudofirmus]